MQQRNDLIEIIEKKYAEANAPWEEVNIFGIRREEDQNLDIFNDLIGISAQGELILVKATTDPGIHFTNNPLTVGGITGAAHLCYGYHRNAWRVGIHGKGKAYEHEALVQTGAAVTIWRDENRNTKRDRADRVQTGYFGINIHRASIHGSEKIGYWSAGCQVVSDPHDFANLMSIIKSTATYQAEKARARFSYMLFSIDELEAWL